MSEPIILYRGGETLTVYAPTWAKELQTHEGWSLQPTGGPEVEQEADDVPFTFREPDAESEPAPKPRRGRKPKGKA